MNMGSLKDGPDRSDLTNVISGSRFPAVHFQENRSLLRY
ncbi:hypothetical protein GMO_01140 [Gluconobacter morbifer G707]|uniref:Uncharacterized protein n=1 Tax=Gluconobacter morbifer G707 TaxID=1088869 RepID=G6XF49_9PROT|nr:hypothetical protein GMO_01140 [Gluconobacter morbifer G707]